MPELRCASQHTRMREVGVPIFVSCTNKKFELIGMHFRLSPLPLFMCFFVCVPGHSISVPLRVALHARPCPFTNCHSGNRANDVAATLTEYKSDDKQTGAGDGAGVDEVRFRGESIKASPTLLSPNRLMHEPSAMPPPPQDSPQTELAPRKRRRKRDDPQNCLANSEVSRFFRFLSIAPEPVCCGTCVAVVDLFKYVAFVSGLKRPGGGKEDTNDNRTSANKRQDLVVVGSLFYSLSHTHTQLI